MNKNRYCSLPMCAGARFDTAHRLPNAGSRRVAWLNALSIHREHLERLQNPLLCPRHFRPEDYNHSESRKLNRVAVPSLNIKELNQLDMCKQVETWYDKECSDENIDDGIKANVQRTLNAANRKSLTAQTEEAVIKRLKLSKDNGQIAIGENIFMTLDEFESSLLGDNEEIQAYVEQDDGSDNVDDIDYDIEDENEDDNADVSHELELKDDYSLNGDETDAYEEIKKKLDSEKHDSVLVKHEKSLEQEIEITLKLADEELIIQESNFMESVHLNYLWLRDICKCSKCFDAKTHERLFVLRGENEQPSKASLDQDCLLIEWHEDHESKYVISELLAQHYASESPLTSNEQMPWSVTQTQTSDFKAMPYTGLICSQDAVKIGLKRLQKYGVLLVQDICGESKEQISIMLELLLRRLFPHNNQQLVKEQRCNFHSAHTLPHTNCTFLSESCGLQLLSLNSATAAESMQLTLVDGLKVAQELSENSRTTFDFLTQFKVPLIYRNSHDFNYHTQAPVIQLQNGTVERIQFAPYQRGKISLQSWQKFSSALSEFAGLVKQPQRQWKLCLSKNMIIILDNWRICWQVENRTAKPVLDCCYVERKDYQSQLHCLMVCFSILKFKKFFSFETFLGERKFLYFFIFLIF